MREKNYGYSHQYTRKEFILMGIGVLFLIVLGIAGDYLSHKSMGGSFGNNNIGVTSDSSGK